LWLASFSNDGNSSVKKTNKTRRWAWNAFFSSALEVELETPDPTLLKLMNASLVRESAHLSPFFYFTFFFPLLFEYFT
jgi:hypothetical protein